MQTLNNAQNARLRRFQQLGLIREWGLTWGSPDGPDGECIVKIVTGGNDCQTMPLPQLNAYLSGLAHGSWIGQAQQRSAPRSEQGNVTPLLAQLAALLALAVLLSVAFWGPAVLWGLAVIAGLLIVSTLVCVGVGRAISLADARAEQERRD